MGEQATDRPPSAAIDTSVPHSARIWNYWLGGKDNYPVDRAVGDQVVEMYPAIMTAARASRRFLIRAITYLTSEAGIRQFLDVGTGLPTVDNTHQVAQSVAPESKIVYVDNDPLVLAHARALLTGDPRGATAYIDADLREPRRILESAAATLTFTEPAALILSGVMGHIADDDTAYAVVATLVGALPSGSYLVLSDGTDSGTAGHAESMEHYRDSGAVPYRLRHPDRLARFFDGLDVLEPGLVTYDRWRPETPEPEDIDGSCGVARKP